MHNTFPKGAFGRPFGLRGFKKNLSESATPLQTGRLGGHLNPATTSFFLPFLKPFFYMFQPSNIFPNTSLIIIKLSSITPNIYTFIKTSYFIKSYHHFHFHKPSFIYIQHIYLSFIYFYHKPN